MKNYFPFTDYDFYAYLASGGLMLAAFDYAINNATYLRQPDWTFAQIAVVIMGAYVLGHLIAMFAQTILENFIVSKLISKPINLQLGFKEPNLIERVLGFLVGRYYGPLPTSVRNNILEAASCELGRGLSIDDGPEEVFLVGFRKSFEHEAVRARIDEFRNQYGFCRNIAFVGTVAFGLFVGKAVYLGSWLSSVLAVGAAVASLGMFIRYLKFLASFQAEVIRVIGK